MTVAATTNRTQADGNGSTSAFPFTFKYTAKSQIEVYVDDTLKTLDTHYTLTDPSASGGTVTFITSPTDFRPQTGEKVTIRRILTEDQGTFDPTSGGGFNTASLEGMADDTVMKLQQVAERVNRAPKLKLATASTTPTFPEPSADALIGWNAAGDDLENKVAADIDLAVVSPFIATLLDDTTAAAARSTLGAGDVTGPASSTAGNLPSFSDTGGKDLDDSGIAAADVVVASDIANMLETTDIGVSVQAYDVQLDGWSAIDPATAAITFTNTGLHLLDTNASHDLIIAPGSDLSADRTLTLTTGDANRTLTLNTNVELAASAAQVRTGSASAAILASHLTSANEPVTLTDAATIAIDWTAGINFTVTITTNRILGNPTNEIPGTWRTVFVISDGGPDELTFGSEYGGTPPTLDDITTTKGYLLSIYCRATSQFLVFAADGSPA